MTDEFLQDLLQVVQLRVSTILQQQVYSGVLEGKKCLDHLVFRFAEMLNTMAVDEVGRTVKVVQRVVRPHSLRL